MVMKCLYIFGLIFLWLDYSNGAVLKYPHLLNKIVEVDNDTSLFEITWNPVKNWDENDPIIGYKIIIWKMKTGTKLVHRFVNGELFDEEVEYKSFPGKVPAGPPKIFTVPADHQRKVVYDNVKANIWYQLASLAFTKKGEGPISPITGIK